MGTIILNIITSPNSSLVYSTFLRFAGPKTWIDVYKDCGGKFQSPIDLGIPNAAVYRSGNEDDVSKIKFSDGFKKLLEGKLFNNGHTGKYRGYLLH